MITDKLLKKIKGYLHTPGFGGLMLSREELVQLMKLLDPTYEPKMKKAIEI